MIGKILDNKYRVNELIGTGGMAHVYKAVQLSSPHHTVAIKVLKEEYAEDAAFLRRFDMEAQAVLELSHDHIVRLFDIGQQGTLHYIVLEHVEGSTLKKYIGDKGRIAPRTAIQFAAQILDALNHAHERGIIHRDVKPQNVIVTPKGKLKLADFGIARNTASSNTMTFAGSGVLGSVQYLSPEQAKGQAVTLESDIYSMGITLYEMVTGQVPFDGENSVSIALMHLQEELPPPITLVPDMPGALNDIICKATQKNPAHRYHSAKEMRRDLLRALKEPAGDFAKLERTDGTQPPRKRKKRRRLFRLALVTLLAVGLFLSLFLIARSLFFRDKEPPDLVPTLVGKTVKEAQTIAELRGYTLEILESIPSDTLARGTIAAQMPTAGAELKLGGTVSVTPSSGPDDTAYVPELIGLPLLEAEELLSAAGLVAVVGYQTSDQPAGTIIAQDPAAATALLHGDEVEIYVSGEIANSIETPNVLNMPLTEAFSLLQDRGFQTFRVSHLDTFSPDSPPDTVVRQTPAQGELVGKNAVATLVISKQRPPANAAEISCVLNVPQDGMAFYAVVEQELAGVAYQRIVYSDTLRAGEQQQLNFTAVFYETGVREVCFVLGNAQVGSVNVAFQPVA